MVKKNLSILAIGAGNMGMPVITALAPLSGRIIVVSPHQKKFVRHHIEWRSPTMPLPVDFIPDIILLAVKPQIADDVLPRYSKYHSAIFLSIMAGKTIADMEKLLGNNKKIFRAMTNMLIKTQKGITFYCTNQYINKSEAGMMKSLLEKTGMVMAIKEDDFNLATSLFGSTPGFVFYLAEVFADSIKDAMVMTAPRPAIEKIVADIIGGAMAMKGDKPFSQLTNEVASKSGMTEAGLAILRAEFPKLWARAINAAAKRGDELSSA